MRPAHQQTRTDPVVCGRKAVACSVKGSTTFGSSLSMNAASTSLPESPQAAAASVMENLSLASPLISHHGLSGRAAPHAPCTHESGPYNVTISGRDRDSQMIPGAWTQSSVANPAYGTRTCTAEFAPRRARNDCAKTGTVSSGAQTGGETTCTVPSASPSSAASVFAADFDAREARFGLL